MTSYTSSKYYGRTRTHDNIVPRALRALGTKIQESKIHTIRCFPAGSFAVRIGDHLRFGIICGPIWGSFPVWGSFAVGDHLRRCTNPAS